MPAVAKAVSAELSAFRPDQAKYFSDNEQMFEASLKPWLDDIAKFKSDHPATPVADYLLQALGADIKTPNTLEMAAIMTAIPGRRTAPLRTTC